MIIEKTITTEKKTTDTERRRTDRRAGAADRRTSGPASRLRKGLWLEYHRRTEAGKFDPVDPTIRFREGLAEACAAETARYEFTDRATNRVVDPSTLLTPAIDVALARLRQKETRRTAITVIEEIANYLLANYNVASIDRRKAVRRATALR